MRTTVSRKSLAAVYALGLIWVVAVVGGAVALMQPMSALYASVGIEDAVVETSGTMVLVILLATAVTAGVALILRATAGRDRATEGA